MRLLGLRGGYPVRVADGAVALPVEEKVLEGEMGSGTSVDGLVVVDKVVGVVMTVLMVEDFLHVVEELLAVVSGAKVGDVAELELAYDVEDEDEVVLIWDDDVLALVDNNDDSGEMEPEGEVEVVFAIDEALESVDDREDSAELGVVCELEVVLVKDEIGAVPVEINEGSVGVKLVKEADVMFANNDVLEAVDDNKESAELGIVGEAEVVFVKESTELVPV